MFSYGGNFRLTEEGKELNNSISLTVPNQSMTVRELFDRFSSGRNMDVGSGYYTVDEDFPDVGKMDKIQMAEFSARLKETISVTQARLAENKRLKKDAEEQQRILAAAEKLIAEKEIDQKPLGEDT